jgi:hypothetical protein
MPNSSTNPLAGVTVETGPVRCGHCRHVFTQLVIEEIDGAVQLRCEGVIIQRMEARCLHCGWVFKWYANEKDIQTMTLIYKNVLEKLQLYKAE